MQRHELKELKVGDQVKKSNQWVVNDFDSWGRGIGIGEVVDIDETDQDECIIDIRWPSGRCYEHVTQITKVI